MVQCFWKKAVHDRIGRLFLGQENHHSKLILNFEIVCTGRNSHPCNLHETPGILIKIMALMLVMFIRKSDAVLTSSWKENISYSLQTLAGKNLQILMIYNFSMIEILYNKIHGDKISFPGKCNQN